MSETNDYTLRSIASPEEWNDLMNKCFETAMQQTWIYGQSVARCIQWEPVRQVVMGKQGPVALAQSLIKELPLVGRVARMQHGPMFIPGDRGLSLDEVIGAIEAFKQYWVADQKMTLYLTPCLKKGDLPKKWAAKLDLEPSHEDLWASIRLDLGKTPEQLHKSMNRHWRRSLRHAANAGLEFKLERSDADLEMFLEKYAQAAREKGFSWPSPELVREIWSEAGDKANLVLALSDGEWISAMVNLEFCGTGFGLSAWNGPLAGEMRAHSFLFWHSALHYRDKGCHFYDLGGIDPERLPGITRFKTGIGGQIYEYLGNFSIRPDKNPEEDGEAQTLAGLGLGHIIQGLPLPQAAASDDESSAKPRIARMIVDQIKRTHGFEMDLEDDTSLIDGGLIDSLSMVTLVQALQDEFDVDISPADLTLDNFDTLKAIAEFIIQCRQERRLD